jgi:hypothetical protein
LASAPVDHVPLVATVPLHAPEAVQAVAFSEFQLKVDVPPLAVVVGDADSVTAGEGEVATTSADSEADPPGPVQVSVKLVVAVRGSVVAVPLVGWVPLHPPDAAQVWASFALHCNVTRVPMATLFLAAARVTAGFAAAPVTGSVTVDWEDEDCWHAANAENATHPNTQRTRRETPADENDR